MIYYKLIEQTKLFINELSEVRKINSTDLVKVTYGDNGGNLDARRCSC